MLMRQIEKECNEWNNGYKSLSGNAYFHNDNNYNGYESMSLFLGGTGKLGGVNFANENKISLRELTARAALHRISKEEVQLCHECGSNSNTIGKSEEESDEN